jgi:hypothetical protein
LPPAAPRRRSAVATAHSVSGDSRIQSLSHARVAFPLDLCHLAGDDFDLERTVSPDTACPSLERNFVMTGRQRHSKAPIVIGGKRCDFALWVCHRECRVSEWSGTGSISPHGAGFNGTDRNHAFDPRRGLPGINESSHKKQSQRDPKSSESHCPIYAGGPEAVNNRAIRRTKGTRTLNVETRTFKVEYKSKNRLPVNDANERDRTQIFKHLRLLAAFTANLLRSCALVFTVLNLEPHLTIEWLRRNFPLST